MKLLLFVLASLAVTAQASEIKVLDIGLLGYKEVKSARFNINKDLGRAWVEIVVDDVMGDPDSDNSELYRQKIEGLSYDKTMESISLVHEGQIIECAAQVTRGRSIFRRKTIENKDCSFRSEVVTVDYDNGFEIVKRKRLHVFLITK